MLTYHVDKLCVLQVSMSSVSQGTWPQRLVSYVALVAWHEVYFFGGIEGLSQIWPVAFPTV